MALPGSDDFTGVNGAGLSVTKWNSLYSDFLISSNRAVPLGGGETIANWIQDTLSPDQIARVTIISCASNAAAQAVARLSGTNGDINSISYYGLYIYKPGGVNELGLQKYVLGTFTSLAIFSETWTDGNKLEIHVDGTNIHCYMDSGSGFVELAGSPVVDASIATGNSGMRSYQSVIFDDFYTDNIGPPYDNVAPVSDISAGSWTPSSGSNLYSVIDEISPDDGEYIISPFASTSAVVALGPHGIPQAGGVAKIVIFHFRA